MRIQLPGPPRIHSPESAPRPAEPALSPAWAKSARTALAGLWVLAILAQQILAPAQRALVWPAAYLALELVACASLCLRALRSRGDDRLAWTLLAASAVVEVPNILLTFLAALGRSPLQDPHLSGLLSLATGILVLAGVLSYPRPREPGGSHRRVLDSLLFATSLLFLLWVVGVSGALHSAHRGLGLRVLAAYLNVALLGGSLVFVTSFRPGRLRGPLGWLAASALAWLAALSGWALAGFPAVPAVSGWIVAAGGIPVFQGLAAWSRDPGPAAGEPAAGRLTRMLPYAPVVAALAVMAGLIPRASLEVLRGASAIFLAMVGLLLLRQFQAIQDLQAARLSLEDRVRRRTRDLERAQDTLLRNEKLNTVALMGAGLAHDLNNLLASIQTSAELAQAECAEGQAPAPGALGRISAAADRAALLTHGLMGFVRREAEELAPTDLAREVLDMEATLRLILPRSVDLTLEVPGSGHLLVWSSRTRLEQMLVNLVANARDAMPDGGLLAIRAAAEPGHALIEVADTGTGMAPEILEHIFELFFTTKPPGRGTGMGLPSLKAMVEEGGGRLEVASAPGQGSRFRIFLPIFTPS